MRKSLTDLRMTAQALNVSFSFSDTYKQLEQKIELKKRQMESPQKVVVEIPPYDARLMTARPAGMITKEDMLHLLEPYIDRGLVVEFPEVERWKMHFAKRTDSGSMRMPLRTMMRCAERLMR